ncbi:hypothetical protein [Paracoccus sp. (in: a-proteobacteria)]|uniref:hypothetical protein n=1 Tax=Paracoccus sp. TaxID=267 RepID=UPI002AFF9900|nr:hypothetical protein [Paracoccus sp. (in: a-proteobacteria)]
MAREIGYRPTDVKNRVQEHVDEPVTGKVTVTSDVAGLPGAAEGQVTQTAEAVEGNALRMVGKR